MRVSAQLSSTVSGTTDARCPKLSGCWRNGRTLSCRCRAIIMLHLELSLSLISAIACKAETVRARSSSDDRPDVKSIQKPSPRDDDLVTRYAVCRWAEQAPVLDGKLDDRCWEKAAVIDHFATFWTVPKFPERARSRTSSGTTMRLHYAGSMTDAELRAFGTRRNDSLWNGDVFELFLKPSAERPEYYEFQANPRGIVFEAAFPRCGHQFPGGFKRRGRVGKQGRRHTQGYARPTRRHRRTLDRRRPDSLVCLQADWGCRSQTTSGCSPSVVMTTARKEPIRSS